MAVNRNRPLLCVSWSLNDLSHFQFDGSIAARLLNARVALVSRGLFGSCAQSPRNPDITTATHHGIVAPRTTITHETLPATLHLHVAPEAPKQPHLSLTMQVR